MNVVCLSNLGMGSDYIVSQVLRDFPTAKLIRITGENAKSLRTRKWRKIAARGWLRRLEERLFYRRFFEGGSEQVKQLLYGSAQPPTCSAAAELSMAGVNDAATALLLRSLRPDILLVVGAPMLKPHIFSIPQVAAINVHFGIAPHYRGENTLFWPLYYRDYDNLGVTIHLIDHGIDSGPVLAHGFLDIAEDDTQWTVEAKAARVGAELVVELLNTGQFVPREPVCSTTAGRQFNYKARRARHDILYEVRRLFGERPSPRPGRYVNYCCAPADGAQYEAAAEIVLTGS